jgi:hypothetical protein
MIQKGRLNPLRKCHAILDNVTVMFPQKLSHQENKTVLNGLIN